MIYAFNNIKMVDFKMDEFNKPARNIDLDAADNHVLTQNS